MPLYDLHGIRHDLLVLELLMKTYTELCQHATFEDRFHYLQLHGKVGEGIPPGFMDLLHAVLFVQESGGSSGTGSLYGTLGVTLRAKTTRSPTG